MPRYESEINLLPSGEVVVVTKSHGREPGNEYFATTERTYPSVAKLRRSLAREKLRSELLVHGSQAAYIGGGGAALSALYRVYPYNEVTLSEVSQFVTGTILAVIGNRWQKHEEINQLKVDSRIRAFNTVFPDLKPIPLGFKDYLATIRIPFVYR